MAKTDHKKIISASRRVEMPGFFPEKLIEMLRRQCPSAGTHTIVLWSKHPENLLRHRELKKVLCAYEQLFLHITVTGMGGTDLEPNIPPSEEVLALLPGLVQLAGCPERVRLRFDPVVHIRRPDGSVFSNLKYFNSVARAAAEAGITHMITSWMTVYPKTAKRLQARGMEAVPVSVKEMTAQRDELQAAAHQMGISLAGCCTEVLPRSACIDGGLLSRLHPRAERAPSARAGGQRPACGCSVSRDIGWYYPCPGGCLYCYGNPAGAAGQKQRKDPACGN